MVRIGTDFLELVKNKNESGHYLINWGDNIYKAIESPDDFIFRGEDTLEKTLKRILELNKLNPNLFDNIRISQSEVLYTNSKK